MSKIPVTRRALMQRINRMLAKSNKRLMAYRGNQAKSGEGFYVVDTDSNKIIEQNCRLETVAAATGALKGYEVLI